MLKSPTYVHKTLYSIHGKVLSPVAYLIVLAVLFSLHNFTGWIMLLLGQYFYTLWTHANFHHLWCIFHSLQSFIHGERTVIKHSYVTHLSELTNMWEERMTTHEYKKKSNFCCSSNQIKNKTWKPIRVGPPNTQDVSGEICHTSRECAFS